jgi:hypothetical protein
MNAERWDCLPLEAKSCMREVRMTRSNFSCRRNSPERSLGLRFARIAAPVPAALAFALVVNAQQFNELPLVVKATKCQVVVNVQWNRHDTNFPQKAEFAEVFATVDSSGLYRRYKGTSADHADLIFKLDDDALLDRITLEVLNPDDNSAVYFETRDRVAVANDVKRLIAHFLAAVDSARDSEKGTDESFTPSRRAGVSDSDSSTNDQAPGYVWAAQFDDQDSAQEAAKEVQNLGLPVSVVARHTSNGHVFVVVSGPYGSERAESAVDYLSTHGFPDARWDKSPPAIGRGK